MTGGHQLRCGADGPRSHTRLRRALAVATAASLGWPCAEAGAKRLHPADLGRAGLTAQGTHATAATFVRVPPGYRVGGGTVVLRLRHSPLLVPERSTVTLLVDGNPLVSRRLTRAGAEGTTIRARLPQVPAASGGFTLAARFAMRLTADACEDPRNAALWAHVLPSTTVDATLEPANRTAGAAASLLAPPASGRPVRLQVSPQASGPELEAAGLAAGAIGRADRARDADPLLELGDLNAATAGLVVASGPAASAALDEIGGSVAPARRAFVGVAPRGAPRVAIGGVNTSDVLAAARSFAAAPLTPAVGTVTSASGRLPVAPAASLPWRESAASFAQLGLGAREVVGAGTRTLELPVDRPPSWALTDDGELDLVVDPGGALRAETSSVTVTMGGQRIGTRRLPTGGGPAHLKFALPAGLLDRDLRGRPQRGSGLSLRFDLQGRQSACEAQDDSGTRITVLPTSSITLPHRVTDERDLARFPAPVATREARATIVVPNEATAAELGAGLQVAAAIGRWAEASAPLPRLTRARELRDRAARANLVLIGAASRDLGRSVSVANAPRLAAGEGLLAVRSSPWAGERSVLIVQGADDAGLARAAMALTRRASVERLTGSVARVAPRSAPVALAATPGDPPVLLAPVLDEGPLADLPPWAVPAAVVLVAFLVFIVVLVRRRVRAAR